MAVKSLDIFPHYLLITSKYNQCENDFKSENGLKTHFGKKSSELMTTASLETLAFESVAEAGNCYYQNSKISVL